MRKYGLIGYPLGQSKSAAYFTAKFDAEHIDAIYSLYEMPTLTLPKDLDGYSVTIPYKEAIIPYLSEIDATAAAIGAVNCVKQGKGYNTDYVGVLATLDEVLPQERSVPVKALVFGSGGAAKAVLYALRQRGIAYCRVSRSRERGDLLYEQITPAIIGEYKLLINCTPLGMYNRNAIESQNKQCVDIPYRAIGSEHILFDCIYNPAETEFLRRGRLQGACTINGERMFTEQAEQAWKIWNNEL